uniref:Uncharacterized protein n=1 Tax=Solanum lycopersicum TaxID=4081 RepID=A0A3Q7GYG5_SOLLC
MVRFPTGRRNEEGRRKLILPKNRKLSAIHGKMDMELDVFRPTESELFTFLLRFIV